MKTTFLKINIKMKKIVGHQILKKYKEKMKRNTNKLMKVK